MIPGLFPLARPLLHALDAETAHQLTIKALALAPHGAPPADDPRLAVEAFGRRFPNPVGLAAGFDKQCEVPDALLALGFGFVELGGVVPKPQAGNPKPRVFRLPGDEAVINRLGLNSDGLPEAVRERLAARRRRRGIVGVNIGANKDSPDRAGRLRRPASRRSPASSTSSPSTSPRRTRRACATFRARPSSTTSSGAPSRRATGPARRQAPRPALLLKIAPDLALDALDALVATALRRGVDGLIVSNTTIARPAELARARARQGERRALGQAALRAFDDDARRNLSAGRGQGAADRRRRRRLGRGGLDQDPRRREPRPALHGARLQGPGADRGDQARPLPPARRRGAPRSPDAVGRDAARIAAGSFG